MADAMAKRRATTLLTLVALLTAAVPATLQAGGFSPVPGAADRAARSAPARTCLNPATAPLRLAQGVILCCCIDTATKGQCCNYVNATACSPQVPGCGC